MARHTYQFQWTVKPFTDSDGDQWMVGSMWSARSDGVGAGELELGRISARVAVDLPECFQRWLDTMQHVARETVVRFCAEQGYQGPPPLQFN